VIEALAVFGLSAVQSVTFCMSSRARNRGHRGYAAWSTAFAAAAWFVAFRQISLAEFDMALVLPYVVGAVFGNLIGAEVSMRIERIIVASADGHLE